MSRRGAAVGVLGGVALLAGGGYYAVHTGLGPLPSPEGCTANVEHHTVALSIPQAENASIIAAVAERRGLPARAISIAIATAYQESKLVNVSSGDRDSLGLFQQRPSQGWGTPRQIRNPYYAANAFYDALVKVDGYQDMPITDAAQAVQHSAFPTAYANHELDGRTVASAMSGYSAAAFTCVVHARDNAGEQQGSRGLTPRARAVRRAVTRAFGSLPMVNVSPAVATSRHGGGSAHSTRRAVEILIRPITADSRRRGWVLASYLVANASRLSISRVVFDGRAWTTGTPSEHGWQPARSAHPSKSASRALLQRDRVKVDVA
jgi:hypothetical protein